MNYTELFDSVRESNDYKQLENIYNIQIDKQACAYAFILFVDNELLIKLNSEIKDSIHNVLDIVRNVNYNCIYDEHFVEISREYINYCNNHKVHNKLLISFYFACIYVNLDNDYAKKYISFIKDIHFRSNLFLLRHYKTSFPIYVEGIKNFSKKDIKSYIEKYKYNSLSSFVDFSRESFDYCDDANLITLIKAFIEVYEFEEDNDSIVKALNECALNISDEDMCYLLFRAPRILPNKETDSSKENKNRQTKDNIKKTDSSKENENQQTKDKIKKLSIKDIITLNKYKNTDYEEYLDDIYKEEQTIKEFVDKYKYNGLNVIEKPYLYVHYLSKKQLFNVEHTSIEDRDRYIHDNIEKYVDSFNIEDCEKIINILMQKEFFVSKAQFDFLIGSAIWQKVGPCQDKRVLKYIYKHYDYLKSKISIEEGARYTKRLKSSFKQAENSDSSSCLMFNLIRYNCINTIELREETKEWFKEDFNYIDMFDIDLNYALTCLQKQFIDNDDINKYYVPKFAFSNYDLLCNCLYKNGYFNCVERVNQLLDIVKVVDEYLPLPADVKDRYKQEKRIKDKYIKSYEMLLRLKKDLSNVEHISFEYRNDNKQEYEIKSIGLELKKYIREGKHGYVNYLIDYAIDNDMMSNLCVKFNNVISDDEKQAYFDYLSKLLVDRFDDLDETRIRYYIELGSYIGFENELDKYTKDYDLSDLYYDEDDINAKLYMASTMSRNCLYDFINMDNVDNANINSVIHYLVKRVLNNSSSKLSDIKKFFFKFSKTLKQDGEKYFKFDTYNLQDSNTPFFDLTSEEDIDFYLSVFPSRNGICQYYDLLARYIWIDNKKIYINHFINSPDNNTNLYLRFYFVSKILSYDKNIFLQKDVFRRIFDVKLELILMYDADRANKLLELEMDVLGTCANTIRNKDISLIKDYYEVYTNFFKRIDNYIFYNCCCKDNNEYYEIISNFKQTNKYIERYNDVYSVEAYVSLDWDNFINGIDILKE